jgi:hypothetical protein
MKVNSFLTQADACCKLLLRGEWNWIAEMWQERGKTLFRNLYSRKRGTVKPFIQ